MHISHTHSSRGTHAGKGPHPTMTNDIRRQAPDERATTDNTATPHSFIPQAITTRTIPTPHSPLLKNRDAQPLPPTKTVKTNKSNLEKPGPHLNTLETT